MYCTRHHVMHHVMHLRVVHPAAAATVRLLTLLVAQRLERIVRAQQQALPQQPPQQLRCLLPLCRRHLVRYISSASLAATTIATAAAVAAVAAVAAAVPGNTLGNASSVLPRSSILRRTSVERGPRS